MKAEIEYAALTRGITLSNIQGYLGVVRQEYREHGKEWNPLHDDGDSRRLEIACLNWIGQRSMLRLDENIYAANIRLNEVRGFGVPATPEDYREAVFALAVAIGKVIDGGGA